MGLQANNDGEQTKTNKVNWLETQWDFGRLQHNKDATHEFEFTNTSHAPVLITKVRSSCGCTVGSYDKDPILPGEKGKIKVEYNAKKVGSFKKTATVTLSTAEVQVLKIEGKVSE